MANVHYSVYEDTCSSCKKGIFYESSDGNLIRMCLKDATVFIDDTWKIRLDIKDWPKKKEHYPYLLRWRK